jgi:hypothetical protein
VSCKKAQKYFEQNNIGLKSTSDARKEKIDKDQAWGLISGLSTVYIGKGKKVLSFEPDGINKEEILRAALGRTGNLRAPALKTGNAIFIGFNDNIYSNL